MSASEVQIDAVAIELVKNSLQVERRIEARSVAQFTVFDQLGIASYVRGQPVTVIDPDTTTVFTGFIDTIRVISVSPAGGLYHSIRCMDNHYLADKRLIIKAYTDELAGDIVKNIRTDYLNDEGVTLGTIQDGLIVEEAVFNYVKASEAFDALAEMMGFTWYISTDKKLYFIDRTTNLAPFPATGDIMLKNSASLQKGNPLFRNRQYVRGGTGLTTLQTENRTGDGVTTIYTMGYPLAKVPEITEDGVPTDEGIKGVDTGKDWYWAKGDNVVYAAVAPAGAVAIQIKYYGQYPLISRADDAVSIVARAAIEGGTGVTEDIILEANESSEAAMASARAKLANYCRDAEKFTFQTRESGLLPGQFLPVTYAPFGFIAHDMLIESVTLRSMGGHLYYTVTAITGPVSGTWAKFFSDILTRLDRTIRIGDDLLVAILQAREELILVESTAFASYTPPTYVMVGHTGIAHELLALSEATTLSSHAKNDYKWDAADALWDFSSWG